MLKKIKSQLFFLIKDERGASAIEYGLIAALIAAVIAVSVTGLGTSVNDKLAAVCEKISGSPCDSE